MIEDLSRVAPEAAANLLRSATSSEQLAESEADQTSRLARSGSVMSVDTPSEAKEVAMDTDDQ